MKEKWRELRRSFYRLSSGYRKVERLEARVDRLERTLFALTGMEPGERQVAVSLQDVRADHLGRYEFAASYLKSEMRVLDIACGVGYGSYILAKSDPGVQVEGVDISDEAVAFAQDHYKLPNNNFEQGDALSVRLPSEVFDMAVSFETIEHIDGDQSFFGRIYDALKPGGLFICSTPNQAVSPFSAEMFPYHLRHYTIEQISELLTNNGFDIVQIFSQHNKNKKDVVPGSDGVFHIIVSCKRN